MSEWPERVLDRVDAAIAAYERGDVDLPGLQSEVGGAASALESPDRALAEALLQAEAELDSIRFTVPEDEQRGAVMKALSGLRAQMRHTSGS